MNIIIYDYFEPREARWAQSKAQESAEAERSRRGFACQLWFFVGSTRYGVAPAICGTDEKPWTCYAPFWLARRAGRAWFSCATRTDPDHRCGPAQCDRDCGRTGRTGANHTPAGRARPPALQSDDHSRRKQGRSTDPSRWRQDRGGILSGARYLRKEHVTHAAAEALSRVGQRE